MIVSILIFLIVLSILVLIHELGHFFVARRAGVWVEEFGFGLPPRVLGKKIGETIYSLNLLPFGGFVKLHGESTDEGVTKPMRAFINQSKKVRVAIIVSGVVMNFLLAIAAFSIVYSFSGIPRKTDYVKILETVEGAPVQIVGVKTGDFIREVDYIKITHVDQFIDLIEERKGKETILTIEREGELINFDIVPRVNPPQGQAPLGVIISSYETYFPPIWQRPFLGVYHGFKEALFWGGTVILGFAKIIRDLFSGIVPKDIAGPVGIYAVTSEAAKFGILALVNFVGVLSVNLAVLNIIPFPALDGGRIMFIGIETILGKKILPKAEAITHTVGMIILMILILAITAHDIQRLIAAGSVSGFIESILK